MKADLLQRVRLLPDVDQGDLPHLYPGRCEPRAHEWDARWWSPITNAEHVLMAASRLLDDDEVDWLAKGWWTPIESVRPSNLIKRLAAAANLVANDALPVEPSQRASALLLISSQERTSNARKESRRTA